MTRSASHPIQIVIAGGGVAAVEAALALRALAGDRVALTLLAPTDELVLRPMAVAEPFSTGRAEHFALAQLLGAAGAVQVRDGLAAVDPERRVAHTQTGRELTYDRLIVACGAHSRPAFPHAVNFDDERADELLHGLVQDVEGGYVSSLAIVIPAPPPWPLPAYELALQASERAWDSQVQMTVTVLTPESAPLAVFGPQTSAEVTALLAQRGVSVVPFARCEVTDGRTILIGPEGRRLQADRIIALPALRGPGLAGLPADAGGFIAVDERGRVRDTPGVWAAGDATDFPVRMGGVATQLADTIAADIAAQIGIGVVPPAFAPRLDALLLTGGRVHRLDAAAARGREHAPVLSQPLSATVAGKIAAVHLGPELARLRSARRSQPPAMSEA